MREALGLPENVPLEYVVETVRKLDAVVTSKRQVNLAYVQTLDQMPMVGVEDREEELLGKFARARGALDLFETIPEPTFVECAFVPPALDDLQWSLLIDRARGHDVQGMSLNYGIITSQTVRTLVEAMRLLGFRSGLILNDPIGVWKYIDTKFAPGAAPSNNYASYVVRFICKVNNEPLPTHILQIHEDINWWGTIEKNVANARQRRGDRDEP